MMCILMRSALALSVIISAWGCIEDPAVPISEMTPDLDLSNDDRGISEEFNQDPPLEPDATPTPEAPPELGWLEITLSPQQTRYQTEETVEVIWSLFDVYGREVGDEAWRAAETMAPSATYQVDPPTMGRMEEGSLTLLEPGVGQLEVCVAELCERVSFIVDDGPPRVELLTPTQGAMLGGEGGDSEASSTIQVSGSVTDGARSSGSR